MPLSNYFNQNGNAIDDIMQIKAISENNNGEIDDVVSEQIISKYGSLDALYDRYESEKQSQETNNRSSLPGNNVNTNSNMANQLSNINNAGTSEDAKRIAAVTAYNEDNPGQPPLSNAASSYDMSQDSDVLYANDQQNALGQMQNLVNTSGTGGEVLQASTEEKEKKINKENITFGKVVSKIAGIPFQAVSGMFNKVGSAYETLTDEDKFSEWLTSPQTQAGLRMIQAGGTPSFASPFAKMSKALIDTSTYLSAAEAAKSSGGGTNKTTNLLYIPGQNTSIDAMLKSKMHSDGKGTMFDFLVDESSKNNYFKIGMITNNSELVGIDGILRPNSENYPDEMFENYTIGQNPSLDKLIEKAGLTKLVQGNKENKVNVIKGPSDTLYKVESIETAGVDYVAGEFYETYNPSDDLGKKIEARYPGQFKKGDQIKVEAFKGEVNGEINWGDLISVVAANNPKTQSLIDSLESMPRSIRASEKVTEFYTALESSRSQSQALNQATGALMTLDNPEDTLGALQNFFTPFANIIDRVAGDTAFGKSMLEALTGHPDAFKVREEAEAYLNSTIIPKLKELYPVSNKDVEFLKATMANLGSKSYFKLASFYNGMNQFDERMELGLREFHKELQGQGIQGYDYSPDGVKLGDKTYNEAMLYARAWANQDIEREWKELLDDEKIKEAALEIRGVTDLTKTNIGNVTKLTIINYASQKENRVIDTKKMAEKNLIELKTVFLGGGNGDRALELSKKIMKRRFAIYGLTQRFKEKRNDAKANGEKYDDEFEMQQITAQIDSFEERYGLDYGVVGKEEWLDIERNDENYYRYILNELRR